MNLWVLLPLVAGMIVLRLLRPNMLVWMLAWLAALWIGFRYGFAVPVPVSVIKLYMGIAILALLAYVTSSATRREQAFGPLIRLATEPGKAPALVLVVLAIPGLVAFSVYRSLNVPLEPPSFGRTIHPAPPAEMTLHDAQIDLVNADNPYRGLETSDPEEFRRRVERGRETYYRNCHYCHGDNLTGNGIFAHGLNPIPTNFADPATIVQLQESFLMWRIAKGAPGLPAEGGPWDSAMPAWENFLSEEEIWEVILFLYDFTEQRPRARTVHGEGEHE